MELMINPVNGDFAGIVIGHDLERPLEQNLLNDIVEAMDRYAVLVFKGQSLSQGSLVRFAQQFGELDSSLKDKLPQRGRVGRNVKEEIFDVSNVNASGEVASADDYRVQQLYGSRVWHTDGGYKHRPYRYSMLAAEAIPSWGGATEFADLRAAYDDLEPGLRNLIQDRVAEHDLFYWLNSILGLTEPTAEERANNPAIVWPLVRTHPGSGRKLLWVETAVSRISGMSVAEGRALALELLEAATQRKHVYEHKWEVGDLVMWDNRSVLHRGRRFDVAERRQMQRATTAGTDESLGLSSNWNQNHPQRAQAFLEAAAG
jgi:alpha-ketoglutarate-dependent 2,4-dichlorophenoxyacetate dioxygenase